MRLTKYQKARLLEFGWDVLKNESEDDTCWLNLTDVDKDLLDDIKQVLNLPSDVQRVKILVIATQTD